MSEVIPSISILAVIFANCAPLPFAKVRSPLFPRNATVTRIVEALLLVCLHIIDWRLLSRNHFLPFLHLELTLSCERTERSGSSKALNPRRDRGIPFHFH